MENINEIESYKCIDITMHMSHARKMSVSYISQPFTYPEQRDGGPDIGTLQVDCLSTNVTVN